MFNLKLNGQKLGFNTPLIELLFKAATSRPPALILKRLFAKLVK